MALFVKSAGVRIIGQEFGKFLKKSEILKLPIRSYETDIFLFFKSFVVDLYNFPRENTSRNALPNAFSFLGIPTRLLDIKKNSPLRGDSDQGLRRC